MRIDELTPSMTVADISVPSLRPPATTLAPLLTASLIRAWTRVAASVPISDPSGVLPLRGSPATSDPAFAASFVTKASATFSSTTRKWQQTVTNSHSRLHDEMHDTSTD